MSTQSKRLRVPPTSLLDKHNATQHIFLLCLSHTPIRPLPQRARARMWSLNKHVHEHTVRKKKARVAHFCVRRAQRTTFTSSDSLTHPHIRPSPQHLRARTSRRCWMHRAGRANRPSLLPASALRSCPIPSCLYHP